MGARLLLTVLSVSAVSGGATPWPDRVARGDQPRPVAVDLVDLAVALPDAAGSVRMLEWRLEFAEQQNKKGYVTSEEYQAVRTETVVAQQKLKLLKLIAQAELDAATMRADVLRQRREAGSVAAVEDIRAAGLRRELLRQMLRLADIELRTDDRPASPSVNDPPGDGDR